MAGMGGQTVSTHHPGKLHKLSARTVATLTKPGRHSDGGGLYLFISRDSKASRRRWVFRFAWAGKVREMGLGPVNGISLAEARTLAAAARSEVAKGCDPIEARDAGDAWRCAIRIAWRL
jgi:Arm DNA-binding domain